MGEQTLSEEELPRHHQQAEVPLPLLQQELLLWQQAESVWEQMELINLYLSSKLVRDMYISSKLVRYHIFNIIILTYCRINKNGVL